MVKYLICLCAVCFMTACATAPSQNLSVNDSELPPVQKLSTTTQPMLTYRELALLHYEKTHAYQVVNPYARNNSWWIDDFTNKGENQNIEAHTAYSMSLNAWKAQTDYHAASPTPP